MLTSMRSRLTERQCWQLSVRRLLRRCSEASESPKDVSARYDGEARADDGDEECEHDVHDERAELSATLHPANVRVPSCRWNGKNSWVWSAR